MNDRERFLSILAFHPVDRVPNYELGLWGQTIDRWYDEGLPRDVCYHNQFEGEPFFKIDRRAFAHVNAGMVPPSSTRSWRRTSATWWPATPTGSSQRP